METCKSGFEVKSAASRGKLAMGDVWIIYFTGKLLFVGKGCSLVGHQQKKECEGLHSTCHFPSVSEMSDFSSKKLAIHVVAPISLYREP